MRHQLWESAILKRSLWFPKAVLWRTCQGGTPGTTDAKGSFQIWEHTGVGFWGAHVPCLPPLQRLLPNRPTCGHSSFISHGQRKACMLNLALLQRPVSFIYTKLCKVLSWDLSSTVLWLLKSTVYNGRSPVQVLAWPCAPEYGLCSWAWLHVPRHGLKFLAVASAVLRKVCLV